MQPGNTHEANQRIASVSRIREIRLSGSMRGGDKTVIGFMLLIP